MDNQDNKDIIQFNNSLNPNHDNSKKFNDLTNNNQVQNNIPNQQPSINNNQTINVQPEQVNINQPIQVQVGSKQNKKVDNNVVTINNQEVVNLDDYKEDNRFKAKVKEETKEEKQNKKNAVITILVIGILIGIVFVLMKFANKYLSDSAIDNNNALIFVSNAESYINDAKSLVRKDELSTKDLKYAPSCTDESKKEIIIYLDKILSNVNDNKISPFGGEYNLSKSFVKVVANEKSSSCVYEYYIYLTDNNYYMGSENKPLLASKINKDEVKKYGK